jgi:hypothetical protein
MSKSEGTGFELICFRRHVASTGTLVNTFAEVLANFIKYKQ